MLASACNTDEGVAVGAESDYFSIKMYFRNEQWIKNLFCELAAVAEQ